jgi:replicative DNA helicase
MKKSVPPPVPPGPLSEGEKEWLDRHALGDDSGYLAPREMPENIEGEGVLLALGLFYPNQYAALITEIAEADDFWLPTHRVTFDVMKSLVHEGRPINPHTVWATIRSLPNTTTIKSMKALMELKYGIPREHGEALVRDLVAQLRPLGVKRRISRLVNSIGSQAGDKWAMAQDIVTELEIEVEHIVRLMSGLGYERKGFFHVNELVDRFDARLVDLHMGRTDAIPTGLEELDSILNLNGLNRKGLYFIAARPGVGKTSLGLSMMMHQGRLGIPSGFTTLEMDKLILMQRLYSVFASIPFWMFRANMYGKEYDRARAKLESFGKLPFYFMDSAFTYAEARRHFRQLVLGPAKAQVLYTDYLQLMGGPRGRSRYDTVTEVSRESKIIPAELNIPHVVMSQLNRDSARDDRPPEMYDLRESGQLEQDAEAIFALWERPEEREGNRRRKYKFVELIVLKQRNGPTALPDGSNIQLVYFKEYMQYITLGQFQKAQQAAGIDSNRPDLLEEFVGTGPIQTEEYSDDF